MSVQFNSPNQGSVLSEAETASLNKHGVFFKKRVLHALRDMPGLGIVGEEIGVSFGGTRVIDIVASHQREKLNLLFIIECKRAYAAAKRWIFFQDVHQRFRVLRDQAGVGGHSSVLRARQPPGPHVCSEGYEYSKADLKADQNPIFRAAGQLSAGYLGLIARRHGDYESHKMPPSEFLERYVPVMVTNAELLVVDANLTATALESGNMPSPPVVSSVEFLMLKHPFPTPESLARDFRDNSNPPPGRNDWVQVHKETIYVVRAGALAKFMRLDHLNYLCTVVSEA